MVQVTRASLVLSGASTKDLAILPCSFDAAGCLSFSPQAFSPQLSNTSLELDTVGDFAVIDGGSGSMRRDRGGCGPRR